MHFSNLLKFLIFMTFNIFYVMKFFGVIKTKIFSLQLSFKEVLATLSKNIETLRLNRKWLSE